MKTHLAILLWATTPDLPELCATPFFHASSAAAMDVEVEIHFAARSVFLLVEGVAKRLHAGTQGEISVYDHIRQATGLGVKLLACSEALAAHAINRRQLIPELAGIAGATSFVSRSLDTDWATLVF